MTDEKPDDGYERLQAQLRVHTDAELAPEIAARLSAIRRQAVAAAWKTPAPSKALRWGWMAVPAAAAALLLTIGVNLFEADPDFPMLDEQELAAAEDLELLEDLEFLAWLEFDGAPNDAG